MEAVVDISSFDGYKYDLLKLTLEKLVNFGTKDWNTVLASVLVNRKKKQRWKLDCAYIHYLVKELTISSYYRQAFLLYHQNTLLNVLVLCPTKVDLIDYRWNYRIYNQLRERCELDHALSWLSTLGGAFSALGDYFERCAETAGKISIHQFKLALKLGDPNIASRCRLYLSISLIQKKRFKLAKKIVENEYYTTKSQRVVDARLLKMCQGIWSKLRYEWELDRIIRKNKHINR